MGERDEKLNRTEPLKNGIINKPNTELWGEAAKKAGVLT